MMKPPPLALALVLSLVPGAGATLAACAPLPPKAPPPKNLAVEIRSLEPTPIKAPQAPKCEPPTRENLERARLIRASGAVSAAEAESSDGPASLLLFPRAIPKEERELVERPVEAECDWLYETHTLDPAKHVIAVFATKTPAGEPASGELATDLILFQLKKGHGIEIVERQRFAEAVAQELEKKRTGLTRESSLDDTEFVQAVGTVVKADYVVMVAVTHFTSENKSDISVEYRLDPDDWRDYVLRLRRYHDQYDHYAEQHTGPFARQWDSYRTRAKAVQDEYDRAYAAYLTDHAAYEAKFGGWVGFWHDPELVEPKQRDSLPGDLPGPPRPLEPLEARKEYDLTEPKLLEYLRANGCVPEQERRLMTVAQVGLTLRMLSVKTSEIVWVGQASKRHTALQSGLRAVAEEVVRQLVTEANVGSGGQ